MRQVLVVDDDAGIRIAMQAAFRRAGWRVEVAGGVTEALARFRSVPTELVITDMRMPDGDGLAVLHGVRETVPGTPVIFLTAFGTVPEAVRAMQDGACDYLVKPVCFERLEETAERFLTARGEEEASPATGAQAEEQSVAVRHARPAECPLVHASAVMRELVERARQAARSAADIVVEAESGTGKELLARFIHQCSARRQGPFVAVNCAAFPETLLESELFGHVRGAFTGATAQRAGKFELADGGTLLLDEVAEMPLSLQPKLLRVLQEREVDRLGDSRPVRVDVRIVATTNRPLAQLVEEKKFRADLYYRLNVVPLTLPPLRDRREDVGLLADHFLAKHAPDGAVRLSPQFRERLQQHHWPGNVRELENFIRRTLALYAFPAEGKPVGAGKPLLIGTDVFETLRPAGGPAASRNASGDAPRQLQIVPGLSLQEAERELLSVTLAATAGNRTRAAELLGVSLRTVRNKIREYGLPPSPRGSRLPALEESAWAQT